MYKNCVHEMEHAGVQEKEKMSLPGKLVATDLIPLINRAWSKSFARKNKNKIAIAKRGWDPSNRILLNDSYIRITMPEQELANEATNNLMSQPIHDNSPLDYNDTWTCTTLLCAQQSKINSVDVLKKIELFKQHISILY